MSKTALQTTADELENYRVGAAVDLIQLAGKDAARTRWELAHRVATHAASLLKQEFSARRVALFGSAVRPETFSLWSDVDLAVWGIPPERFYAAVAAVSETNAEIAVDVVDADQCSANLRAAIEGNCVDV